MLLHQFGHLQLHHETRGTHTFSEVQEEEADQYALNVMKENSQTPTGEELHGKDGEASMYFETGTGIGIHPVTPQRLEAMSHFMSQRVTEFIRGRPDKVTAADGIHSIATLLSEASQWLSVRGHQQELQQLALKTDPSTLQPRPLPRSTK